MSSTFTKKPLFRKGFTLVELLVVMAILGLLTIIGFGNFQTARIKARDVKRKSDLSTIAKSLEAYVNDYSKYPRSQNGQILCPSGSVCSWGSAFTDGKSTYTAILPQDDVSGRAYRYDSSSGADFELYAALENTNDPAYSTSYTGIMCGSTQCNYRITSPNKQ